MSMKLRFEGPDGRRNLLGVLLDNHVVEHNNEIAEALADMGKIVTFAEGDSIIDQGGSDTDTFFIISGEAKVFVNNREVATRSTRDLIGEMVTLNPAAPRSATIKASEEVVVLRISGADLATIADKFPSIWRAIGRVLADRLRERARFHRPQNEQPLMFVGCSVEGLTIANQIVAAFKHDAVTVRTWTTGVFGPSGVPIDDLLTQVHESDFALFVFTPDDHISSRGHDSEGPRDNVIFEMGLFISKLERNRTFMFREHNADLKIPSDLLGVTPITYVDDKKSKLQDQLAAPCEELRQLIRGLGAL